MGKGRARSQRTRPDEPLQHPQLLDVPGLAHLFGVTNTVAWGIATVPGFPMPVRSGRAWGFDPDAVVAWARDRGIPKFQGG